MRIKRFTAHPSRIRQEHEIARPGRFDGRTPQKPTIPSTQKQLKPNRAASSWRWASAVDEGESVIAK